MNSRQVYRRNAREYTYFRDTMSLKISKLHLELFNLTTNIYDKNNIKWHICCVKEQMGRYFIKCIDFRIIDEQFIHITWTCRKSNTCLATCYLWCKISNLCDSDICYI